MPIIKENVKIGTKIMTDEFLTYQKLSDNGYIHETVNHNWANMLMAWPTLIRLRDFGVN